MTDFPLVSIITPSYNQASFLEATIQSVVTQKYPNIEYLVIDGGSTDASIEIIKQYSSHIDWWISEKDTGQAEAINKGLMRAKGEIVAWLNSDDLYANDAIAIAVKKLIEEPYIGMVYGDVGAINAHGEVLNIIRYADWGLEGLMTFQIIGQPAVFLRKELLEKVGYLDTSFQYLLDHQLWLRIAMNTTTKYIPHLMAYARYHPQAKNVALARQFGEEAYRIVKWMKQQDVLKEEFQCIEKKIIAGAHRINARYLLDGGEAKDSLRAYLQSMRNNPAIALKDWKRILFSILAALGMVKTDILNARWNI